MNDFGHSYKLFIKLFFDVAHKDELLRFEGLPTVVRTSSACF